MVIDAHFKEEPGTYLHRSGTSKWPEQRQRLPLKHSSRGSLKRLLHDVRSVARAQDLEQDRLQQNRLFMFVITSRPMSFVQEANESASVTKERRRTLSRPALFVVTPANGRRRRRREGPIVSTY